MEDELPSEDDERTEIENSLYSMFYYHSLSEGLPDDLAEKYDVDSNDFGVTISIKDTNDSNCEKLKNNSKPNQDKVNYLKQTTNDRYLETRDDSGVVLDVPVLNSDDFEENVTAPANITENNIYRRPRYFDDKTVEISKKANKSKPSKSGSKLFNAKSKINETFKKSKDHVELSLRSEKSHDWKSYKSNINLKNIRITSATNGQRVVSQVVDLTEDSVKASSKKPLNDSEKKSKNNKMESEVIAVSSGSESEDESTSESNTDTESDFSFDKSFDSIKINTNRSFNDEDCAVFINTDYDWRETSSPEGWTVSMRRFYNKPSKKMINFNHEDFLNEIRKSNDNDWSIIRADQWNFKRARQIRCIRCNEEGHVKSKCTKTFKCLFCGLPGHFAKICPSNICFKCGARRNATNLSHCLNCYESTTICNLCGIEGHPSVLCTDSWRHFISGIGGSGSKKKGLKYCCNCAKQGHTYDDCKKNTSVSQFKQAFHKQSRENTEVTFPRKNNFKNQRKRSYVESNLLESNTFILSNKKKTKVKHKPNKTKNNQFKRSKFEDEFQNSSQNKRNKNKNLSKRLLMLRRTNKRNYKEHIGMGQFTKMLKRLQRSP